MIQFLIILLNVILRAAFLGPVLYYTWNFGIIKFFPGASKVEALDAMVVIAGIQSLLIWTIRPISREFIPVYAPVSNNESKES